MYITETYKVLHYITTIVYKQFSDIWRCIDGGSSQGPVTDIGIKNVFLCNSTQLRDGEESITSITASIITQALATLLALKSSAHQVLHLEVNHRQGSVAGRPGKGWGETRGGVLCYTVLWDL